MTDPKTATPNVQNHDQLERSHQTIPVIEEAISISRAREQSGVAARVRVVSNEEKKRIQWTEARDEIFVEHVAINRFVNERSDPREEGDVVIVPVYEQVAVVETQLLLKEELHIVRRQREIVRQEEVVLRKERAIVERKDSEQDAWREEPDGLTDGK